MKRKIFATVMALVLCMATLVGCGSSADSSAKGEYEEPTASPEVVEETEEAPTASPEPSNDVEADIQEDANELTEDEAEQVSEEESVPVEEEAVSGSSEVEGIIMLNMYPSHSQLCVLVDAVNPDNGYDIRNVLSLRIPLVAATNEYGYIIPLDTARFGNFQDQFSPDFSKMAITRVKTSNQSMHAGWLDKDGNFFDVTAAVGEAEVSDFEDPARYQAVGFTDDGMTFVYRRVDDYSNYNFKTLGYYAVSVNNITAGASWEASSTDVYLHADSNSWYWLDDYRFSDRIDETHFYADNGDSNTNSCVLIDIESQTMSEFIPGETRNNWSVVASPDSQQVAFMSRPKSGQLNSVELYTMSLSDHSANRVLNIYSAEDAYTQKIRGEYNGIDILCVAIDWR